MKKLLLVLLMLLTIGISGFAQNLSDYVMTTGVDDTRWQTLSTTTNLISGTGDGKASAVTDIGFTFNFAGTDYTQFSVNSDGNLRFGSTVTGTSAYTTPFSSSYANTNAPKINMLGCDGFITDSGYIYHEVIGTAPDRICVIEFATSTYSTTSRNSLLRWQVQLFETSNEIQIVYPSTLPPILPAVARQPGMCVNNTSIILVDANHGAAYFTTGQGTAHIPTNTWPDVDRYYDFTISNCITPSGLTVSDITTEDAIVSWSFSGDDNASFILEYKTTDEDWEDAIVETLSDTTEILSGLEPNTRYDVRVAQDCSGEQSNYISLTFKTECGVLSVSEEPYEEGFEGYATYSFPDCWTRIAGYSTTSYNYPYVNNSASSANSGTGYLYLYNNAANPIYMALPEFVESINELRLSFWMKPAGTTAVYGSVELGLMNDLTNTSSFRLVKSWTATEIGSTAWNYYFIDLDTVTVYDNDFIVFRRFVGNTATSTYAWYFDDVKVMLIPACNEPQDIDVVSTTNNSANLTWDGGDITSFNVYYRTSEEDEFTSNLNVTLDDDSIFTLTGLIGNTTYEWYVASVCSDGSENNSITSTFTTKCDPFETPFTENFSVNTRPNCWEGFSGLASDVIAGTASLTSSSNWNFTNTNVFGAYHAKINIFGTAMKGWLVTPAIDLSTLSTPTLTFDLALTKYNYTTPVTPGSQADDKFMVLISTDLGATWSADDAIVWSNDGNGDYVYDQISTDGEFIAIPLTDYAGQTIRIAFYGESTVSGGDNDLHIDNVNVDEAPACLPPTLLTVTEVTNNTATLEWEANDYTAWMVEYGTPGFTPGSGTPISVTGNATVTIDELTSSTDYEVHVMTECGDSYSIAAVKTFTTACDGITTLPQTWNMDSNLVAGTSTYPLPACWDRFVTSTTSTLYPYSYNSSTYAHSGTRCLYFYNSYRNAMAILPGINPDILDIQNMQLSFYARCSSTSSYVRLDVGVMTNPADTSTFTLIQTIPLTTSYQNDPFIVSFSNYTGEGTYIAFRNTATSTTSASNYFYIDDVTLEIIPNCSKARYLTAYPDVHSADLTWQGNGNSFDVYYKESSATSFTSIQGVTLTEEGYYTLNGLTGATSYSWYIVTNCDDNTSFTSDVATFVTECEGLDSVPQFWGFEDNLTVGTGTYLLPTCWNRILSPSSTTAYPYANTTASYAHNGTHSLYFYYFNAYAILPPINSEILNINELQISFYSRLTSANANIRLLVGVMDSPDNASSFTPVDTIALTNTYGTDPFVVSFSDYEGEGTYIAFKNILLSGSTSSAVLLVDDITLSEIPVCPSPVNMVAHPTPNSIVLSWDDMAEGLYSYNVYYKVDTEEVYIPIENVVPTEEYYIIEDLDASTTYNFYVETVCGEGSQASNVHTLTTLCETAETPFIETFDASSTIPSCWEKRAGLASSVFAGAIPQTTTLGWNFAGTYVFGQYHPKLNIYGTSCNYWLISPDIDLSTLSNPALTFNLALSDYGNGDPIETPTSQQDDKFMVIISTDHGMTWSEDNATIWSNEADAEHVYNQIPLSGQEVIIPLEDYAGETIRIAFYGESTANGGDNDLHIDNVVVDEMPSCNAPSQIVIDSVTAETVYLSWTENGDATSWVVEYGIEGFAPGTGTSQTAYTNESFDITGLADATTYDVYVSAICEDNSNSNFATGSFTTECLPMGVPFTENFDSYETGSAAPFILCWKRKNTYSTSTNYPYVNSTYSVSGNKSLYFYNSTSTYSLAVLPQIDPTVNPISTLQIAFNMRTSSLTCKMVVGAMTNPTDYSTFTPIDTVTVSSANTFEYLEIPLSAYTGNASYVALRLLNTSSTYAAYIDDVTLEPLPACSRPTNLTATAVTENSITISWTPGGDEESWEITYGAPNFDLETEGESITQISTTSYTINNLTSTSTYEFFVRANCEDDGHSGWSVGLQASTTMVAEALPYQTDFTTDQNWLMNNGTVPNHWMMGTPSGATESALFITNNGTTATYTITSSSVAMAEKLFTMPTNDSIHVEFDVKIGGEVLSSGTPYDYLKVFLAPATVEFTPGTSNTQSGYSYSTNAFNFSEYLSQTGSSSNPYKLNLTQGNTLHINKNVVNPDPNGLAKIVFLWRNDGSGGDGQSAIISNFSISAAGDAPVVTDPTVATNAATTIGQTSATLNATITNPDNVTITAKGFEWKTSTGGTFTQVAGIGTGNTFTADLSNLTPNTGYTFKAFITFNGTTVYGSETTFTTAAPVDPTVATIAATAVTRTTATLNGTITNPDNVTITAQGFEWKLTSSDNYTQIAGTVTGNSLTAELSGLTAGTNYTYKAFITFNGNTVYGNEITFNTADPINPTVETEDATGRTQTSATLNATITNPDDVTINSCGFAWKAADSTIYTTITLPSVSNVMTHDLTGLTANTEYTYKAFITFNDSTIYGNDKSFTTLEEGITPCDAPTNLEVPAATITQNSATITWTAGDATNWNVQYKLESDLNWSNIIPVNTSATYNLTGLNSNANYQVRVQTDCDNDNLSDWATVNFTTLAVNPTVSTTAADNITQTTATLNGTITNPDGVTITAQGFEWKVTNDGTYAPIAGTVTGNTLTAELTGLIASTEYTYKAFINYNGTIVYGNEVNFITATPVAPTVSTTAADNITQTTATLNGTITNPDGVTITAQGFEWKVTNDGTYAPIAGTVTGNTLTAELTGLIASTEYTYKAFINYNGTIVYGNEINFSTLNEVIEPCDMPTGLTATNVTTNSATLSWTAGGSETTWKVSHKLATETEWQDEVTVQQPTYTLDNLAANTAYDVHVKAVCADDNESDYAQASFTTEGVGIDNITLANSISLMPNPADNYIDLRINSNIEVKEAVVYNAFGQMIQTVKLTDNHAHIDLSNMAAGMYFLRVNGDNLTATKKFIKK